MSGLCYFEASVEPLEVVSDVWRRLFNTYSLNNEQKNLDSVKSAFTESRILTT